MDEKSWDRNIYLFSKERINDDSALQFHAISTVYDHDVHSICTSLLLKS